MQGQRSAIGSLPDSINFDYGSASSNMGIDQQLCWNTLRDPTESRISDFRIAPGGGDTIIGTVSHEGHNRSRWNTGEPSSSNHQNLVSHEERMTQNGWLSSLTASTSAVARLEPGQVNNEANVISRNGVNLNLNSSEVENSSFFRTSNSGSTSQSHGICLGQLGQVGDLMECSHPSKSGELEHRLNPSSSDTSEPFASSSGSGSFLADEDDGRPGYSLDGRRLSCKRKTIEGNAGQQSSSSGSYFSREGSIWQGVPPRSDVGSSSSHVSPQPETYLGVSMPDPENPRLRLSMGGVPPESVNAPNTGSSRRNYRVRVSPTTAQDSLSNNLVFPPVGLVGYSDVPVGHQPLRFAPVNPSSGLTPSVHPENATSEGQPAVLRLPGMRRNANVQSVRWSVGSSSRAGSSSVPISSVDMDPPLHEDLNSRPPMPRSISEHPMFMPSVETRNTSPSPHIATGLNLNGGGMGASRHASGSRAGSGSSSRSSSGHIWDTNRQSSSQYSRRLSEYVRRSLLSSAGSQGGSTSAQRSAPSQELVLPSVGGAQGHNPPFSRSGLWMDRRGGDGVVGVPYSLRALAAAGGEGRSRLVSEQIRNVLDMMRRGEGLRFEDVMVLDPSVLFGMADIHDQHRDMRLDIDNMSYEELLALEERIGIVSTGLSEETILARLKQRKYLSVMTVDQAEAEPCCICQEEYNDGEDMGELDCGHDFHAGCIKTWLAQKNSCPICKTTGLAP